MDDGIAAMATWVGALARGGILIGEAEERGARLALAVLGEEKLSELREWFAGQPADTVDRERTAAIRLCVWMAHADRVLADEEAALLRQLIARSELGPDTRGALEAEITEAPELDEPASALTQPGLRELVVALAWQLAKADGHLAEEELRALDQLAEALAVDAERVEELKAHAYGADPGA
ncbi:MAG: TerB family tellurite resistance protein [Sandaracinaceae bacterium]